MTESADLCRCGMELDKLERLSELVVQCPRCRATRTNDMLVRESPPPTRSETGESIPPPEPPPSRGAAEPSPGLLETVVSVLQALGTPQTTKCPCGFELQLVDASRLEYRCTVCGARLVRE